MRAQKKERNNCNTKHFLNEHRQSESFGRVTVVVEVQVQVENERDPLNCVFVSRHSMLIESQVCACCRELPSRVKTRRRRRRIVKNSSDCIFNRCDERTHSKCYTHTHTSSRVNDLKMSLPCLLLLLCFFSFLFSSASVSFLPCCNRLFRVNN